MTAILNIRAKRQVTLPEPLLQLVGAEVGDNLVAQVQNKQIILKTQKVAALDAFKAIQKAAQESGVTEDEIQTDAKNMRREWYLKKYAKGVS